mgnify:CR=1 FL=1
MRARACKDVRRKSDGFERRVHPEGPREFGHALHGLLSKAKFPSLAGTSVPRDYVEFPSQIMENWGRNRNVLREFAKHYQHADTISDELLDKLDKTGVFNMGFKTTEYLAASYLDLAWHELEELPEEI